MKKAKVIFLGHQSPQLDQDHLLDWLKRSNFLKAQVMNFDLSGFQVPYFSVVQDEFF
jgi:hypothetical protein